MQNDRCNNCKNYLYGLKCLAFDEIPESILMDENDHSQPLPDQKNPLIIYEPINEDE